MRFEVNMETPTPDARGHLDEPQHRPLESLHYALRALRTEILGFRFDYPLEIDPNAGPKESLHYYLYSERLSWDIMRMDPNGVPRVRSRLAGVVYKPAYIAWWGLVQLGHFLRHHDEASLQSFLKQVNWLESHAVVRADGSVVWTNNFDILHGKTLLKSPWISAYDQGLAISALLRGYRLSRRPRLLELLQGAARIFALDVREGGVREPLHSGALYSELPGQGTPGIQDGFMTSLLGLYDLYVETGDPATGKLFADGIKGLKATLPTWDYRNRWSWYSSRAYLCPSPYHCLNRALLEVLGRLTSDPLLAGYAEAWKPERLSALQRAEIFLAFLVTKNACRVRNRTWRFNRAKVQALAAGKMVCPMPALVALEKRQ
jgi:D-glucuronyl C5-epimerase C-terminus